MEKFLRLSLTLVMLLAFLFSINATASDEMVISGILSTDELAEGRSLPNYGVIEENENARGTAVPTVSAGSRWDFRGEASSSTLFTSRYVTGKTSYSIHVDNYHATKSLRVRAGTVGTTVFGFPNLSFFRTEYVPAGGYAGWTLSDRNASDGIGLEFAAPSNFSGYIEGK